MFILIVVLSFSGNMVTAEFENKASCEAAASKWGNLAAKRIKVGRKNIPWTLCVKK